MGAAPIPGTTEAFNPITGQWKKYDLNQVGNVNGGTWHCVISRLSKNQEATYDFLAFMANQKNAFFNCTHGWTGVQPGMKYEYLPPDGTARRRVAGARLERGRRAQYSERLLRDPALPVQEEYLRIPGAAEYWHELDVTSRRCSPARRSRRRARRHRGGLGEDHRALRAGQAEGALQGLVQGVTHADPRALPRTATLSGRRPRETAPAGSGRPPRRRRLVQIRDAAARRPLGHRASPSFR